MGAVLGFDFDLFTILVDDYLRLWMCLVFVGGGCLLCYLVGLVLVFVCFFWGLINSVVWIFDLYVCLNSRCMILVLFV